MGKVWSSERQQHFCGLVWFLNLVCITTGQCLAGEPTADIYRPGKNIEVIKYKCPTMGCGASAKKTVCLRAAWCTVLPQSSPVQSRACFLLRASDQICWSSSRKVRRDQPGSWCHYSCLMNFPVLLAAREEEWQREGEWTDGFSR